MELAASTGALTFSSSSFYANNTSGSSGGNNTNAMGGDGARRRYSGVPGGGGVVGVNDSAASSATSSSAGGPGGGIGGGGRSRAGGSTPPRVCGSSMVRCVSPGEGAVVSVHHFNTELGSPLVYGTRKGGVKSWDLRTREVRGYTWSDCTQGGQRDEL